MRTTSYLSKSRGFTLVEIAVVLIILAVLISMAAMVTRGVTAAQKRSLTATRMVAVDAALVQFVATQRRLPCPADGRNPSNNAGAEERNAAGVCTLANQAHGVVPWRTLGVTETDATDGYERRLTYRVFPALALSGGMDMSWCDPAGQEPPIPPVPPSRLCNQGCTSATMTQCTPPSAFLIGKGLEVQNIGGVVVMAPAANTGAAYVVISHGESGGGGYLFGGGGPLTAPSTLNGDGGRERLNYADLDLAPHYVDDTLVEATGVGHFDDVVSRPSVLSVITKAGLGPRQH